MNLDVLSKTWTVQERLTDEDHTEKHRFCLLSSWYIKEYLLQYCDKLL